MSKLRLSHRALLVLLVEFFLASFGAPAIASVSGIGDSLGLSPYWDWKTIESEHFRVTFPVELTEVAQKATNYLEEAHTFLSKELYWEPALRTQILVIDNSDLANGLTSPVGRFGLALYVTPPENWFSTAYYDDWLRLLCVHEYTHMLNMDATRNFWKFLRYLYGDVLLPNALWPTWMLEGLAVYMESRHTHSGRGRSPYYEMVLRTAVEENVLDTHRFVTLDRINGTDPYYPGGEAVYLFGYKLMNQIAQSTLLSETADGENDLKNGQDALGIMSLRSSRRIPFFINGNLENITGRDWYSYWAEFVEQTQIRTKAELDKIKSQPVTSFEKITQNGFETLGPAVSPDGNWLAYTQDSMDERYGLYLKNLKTGKVRQIRDKLLGASLAFSPDSKTLFFSEVQRQSEYYLWSDLLSYDLDNVSFDQLTENLRARDPDVSKDGKWIVFTLTERTKTGVAIASLTQEKNHYKIGTPEKIFFAANYDHASTPKFSTDGRRIVFSLHRNGNNSEDLMQVDRQSRIVTPLVSDGHFNRFPTFSPAGEIYFVSDATGVDNMYHYSNGRKPELVTNFTSGVAFPSFGPEKDSNEVYADVFTSTGWDLGKFQISKNPIASHAVTLEPFPVPVIDKTSAPFRVQKDYAVKDYSIFPSILPRQWAPYLIWGVQGVYFGGEILGFDAVDRHRYIAALAYNTQTKLPDWGAIYSNRSFGPTFTFSAYNQTIGTLLSANQNILYGRHQDYSFNVSYPWSWTYSALTPTLSFNTERIQYFAPGYDPGNNDVYIRGQFVPSADLVLNYSNPETSRLAISVEKGRALDAGTRVYLDPSGNSAKGYISDVEHFRVTPHSVLVPAFVASASSSFRDFYTPADVIVQGRYPRIIDSFPGNSLSQLTIRGYPGSIFIAKQAAVASLDYRFPIARIFRGWGTNPVFLDNIWGFSFAETSYFPGSEPGAIVLPSAGGGVRVNTELLLHVPLILSLEYHQGFREAVGGKSELFFQLGLGSFSF